MNRKDRGQGAWTGPAGRLDRLTTTVGIDVYGSAHGDDPLPMPLALDESRLPEVHEARVPVLTPDGPGVLVRENSDQYFSGGS